MTDELGRRIEEAVTPPRAIELDVDGIIDRERRRRRIGVVGGAAAVAVVVAGALVGSTMIAPASPTPGIAAEQPGEFPTEPPIDTPMNEFMWTPRFEPGSIAAEHNDAFWALFEERWPIAVVDPSDPSLEGHPPTLVGTPAIEAHDEDLRRFDGEPLRDGTDYARTVLSLRATYDSGDGAWGSGPLRVFFDRDISDRIGLDVYSTGDFTVGDGSVFDVAFCDESGDVIGWPHECTVDTGITESGLTYAVVAAAGFNESIGKVGSKETRVVLLREDGSAVVVANSVHGMAGPGDRVPDGHVEDVDPFLSVADLLVIAEAMPLAPAE